MEEQAFVQFLKNKSRSMQGATHAEATKHIHDILHVQEHLNKQWMQTRLGISVDFRQWVKVLSYGKATQIILATFWKWLSFSNKKKTRPSFNKKSVCMHRSYDVKWNKKKHIFKNVLLINLNNHKQINFNTKNSNYRQFLKNMSKTAKGIRSLQHLRPSPLWQ